MIGIREFEPGLMMTEQSDRDALAGSPVSHIRSTHMEDGSLVSPEVIEAPGTDGGRPERLRQLKAAIEGGRYFVSANDIADRLMARMLMV
jgi:anti-sigma28 factor (negative regulator of flagellin synthesis)